MKSYSIYASVIEHAQNDRAYADRLCEAILGRQMKLYVAKREEDDTYTASREDCITLETIRAAAERFKKMSLPRSENL